MIIDNLELSSKGQQKAVNGLLRVCVRMRVCVLRVLFFLSIVVTLNRGYFCCQGKMHSCGALISLGASLVSLLLQGFTDGYEIIVRPTVAFLSKMLPLFFFYFTSSSVHVHLLSSNHIFCLPLFVSTAFT